MTATLSAENTGAPPLSVPILIYTRVSDHKQLGRRFESCESQAAICRDFVQRFQKEGWQEIAYLTDPAYTGANMRRPGMEALKKLVAAGGVRKVVIFKLERVLRSTDEWSPFRAFLKQHDCELVSALEDISERTALGRLKNNILVSVSEYDRLNIGEKVRAKMHEQAKRGLWNGGSVPFGYAYDKNTQTLTPDPVDAPVLRRIFAHAADLGSLTDLANALNVEGLRTKLRPVVRRDGTEETIGNRLWRSDALRILIRHHIYKGVVRYAGNEYPAQHEALVTKEVWEQANAATRETKVRPADLLLDFDRHGHVLKGIAWCGHCRRTLVPHASGLSNNAGKRYRYYNCGFVLRERQPLACPVGRLSADALEGAVLGFLSQASRHPALVAGVLQATRSRNKGDRHGLRAELEKTEKGLADVTRELNHCVDAVAKGGIELLGDTLKKRAQDLRRQQQDLIVERERRRQEVAACEAADLDEERVRNSLENLGTLLPKLELQEQKELIRLFIQRVDVNEAPRGAAAPEKLRYPRPRILAVRIKLHLPALVQGVERQEAVATRTAQLSRPVAERGISFETRVDFSRAPFGEITILAPFQHSMSLHGRVLRSGRETLNAPTPKHAVVRARLWQTMLAKGTVATRMALAERMGITPGAVTRILKLVRLVPEIQDFLAGLKTRNEQQLFPIKTVGKLAELPADRQREEFEKMRRSLRKLMPAAAQSQKESEEPARQKPAKRDDAARILEYLREVGSAASRQIRAELALSRNATHQALSKMVAAEQVLVTGKTRNSVYSVPAI